MDLENVQEQGRDENTGTLYYWNMLEKKDNTITLDQIYTWHNPRTLIFMSFISTVFLKGSSLCFIPELFLYFLQFPPNMQFMHFSKNYLTSSKILCTLFYRLVAYVRWSELSLHTNSIQIDKVIDEKQDGAV